LLWKCSGVHKIRHDAFNSIRFSGLLLVKNIK
jgi:hypothetical protein